MEGDASTMTEKKTSVLVAGFDKGAFETLSPVLDRHDFEVARMASPESSVELALATPFDLTIFNTSGRVGTLGEVVDAFRDEKSASRKTSLLVIAEPSGADAAREYIGRGVDTVMLLDDSPEHIGQQVSDLLNVTTRKAPRFLVRFETSVSDGDLVFVGEAVNLSSSGVLVEGDLPFEPDDEVSVTLALGDPWGSVSTNAVVARRAHRDRGGVDGIGIRFANLAGDVTAKIEGYLDKVFADQLNG
jgi:hypothetical protein